MPAEDVLFTIKGFSEDTSCVTLKAVRDHYLEGVGLVQIGGGSPTFMQGKRGSYIKSCKDTVIKAIY